MPFTSFRSATIVLYIIVSVQIDVNDATNHLKNSPRPKRNQFYLWQGQYWPEEQSGVGPRNDQYNLNVYTANQNDYDGLNQFATSGLQYNPFNFYETQSHKHEAGIKRAPDVQFGYIPDVNNLFQNIQDNIQSFSWFPTNNPTTYTQVIENAPNPLKNILSTIIGPEQANRVIEIDQSQNQPGYQNNYYYNNNDYVNRDYESNVNNQQANDVRIQPSIPDNSENTGYVYSTQYNPQLNNNQQQTSRPYQQQSGVSQQSAVSAQTYGQSAFASTSQWSNGYSPQQNQQTNSVNIPSPVEQKPSPTMHRQSSFPQNQNVYMSSAPQQSSSSVQARPAYAQTSSQHTTSVTRQQLATNRNPQKQVKQKQTVQPQVFQTTTTATPIYTRPPASPQMNRAQATQRPQKISQTFPNNIATPVVINSNNQVYTNLKIVPTTKRVFPASQQTTTPVTYTTNPKINEANLVTDNNRPPFSNQDAIQPGVSFKKDSLNLYGSPNVTMVEDVIYPSKTQNIPINSTEAKKPATSSTMRPVTVENRFAANSNPSNQIPTTGKPVKKCETPASQPVPNFSKPGRRISHSKCHEYVWQQQERVSKIKAKEECYRAQGKTFYIAGPEGVPAIYPHMAAIGWRGYNDYWIFKCGGALISPRFVLTSAHCARTEANDTSVVDPVPGLVRLGDRDVAEKSRYGIVSVDVGIRRIIVHPEYSPAKQYNDIALIELEDDIAFSKHVQPACLWGKSDTSNIGNEFIATGWGTVDTGLQNNSPPTLQKVAVNTIDKDTCNNIISSYSNSNLDAVADSQICGMNLNGSLNICQGDSGAPLQVNIPLSSDSEGAMHYIIGISPYKCGRADQPVLYTRVSSFINWIENIVWMSDY